MKKENQKQTKMLKDFKQKGGIYFHSGSIIGRKNIFVANEYLDALVNAIKLAEVKFDIKNIAYVIMPNYFYWAFKLSDNCDNPTEVYGQVKMNVAGEILKNLKIEKKEGQFKTIDLFKKNERVGRSSAERLLWTFEEYGKRFKNSKMYRVWTPKTEIRLIDTNELLEQKIQVIQNAPLSERWQLVDELNKYPYLYLCEDLAEIKVKESLAVKVPVLQSA